VPWYLGGMLIVQLLIGVVFIAFWAVMISKFNSLVKSSHQANQTLTLIHHELLKSKKEKCDGNFTQP
jgi:uncharacterized membrane protein YwzB